MVAGVVHERPGDHTWTPLLLLVWMRLWVWVRVCASWWRLIVCLIERLVVRLLWMMMHVRLVRAAVLRWSKRLRVVHAVLLRVLVLLRCY